MYGRFGTGFSNRETERSRNEELVGLRYRQGNSNLRKAGAMSLSVDQVSMVKIKRKEQEKESEIAELLGKARPKNDHNYLREFGRKFGTCSELPPAPPPRYLSLGIPTRQSLGSHNFDGVSDCENTSVASRGSRKRIAKKGVKRPEFFSPELPIQKRQVYLPTSIGDFGNHAGDRKVFS